MVQDKNNKEEFLCRSVKDKCFYWGKFTDVELEVYSNETYPEFMADVHEGVVREGSLMVLS